MPEASRNVLGHDNRAVHDDAEVDGADRQQPDRNIGGKHQHQCEQQREWYGDRDEKRQARTAEEEEQHQDDEPNADADGVGDRVHGGVDEHTAVIEELKFNAVEFAILIQFLDRFVNFFDDG